MEITTEHYVRRYRIVVLVVSIELGEKVAIYSSSTRTLDRVETMMQVNDWKREVPSLSTIPCGKFGGYKKGRDYLRIDGRVSSEKRGPIVKKFNETPSCNVVLISSEAGGIGINLVSQPELNDEECRGQVEWYSYICFSFFLFFRRLQPASCYWIVISTRLFRLNVYRDHGA